MKTVWYWYAHLLVPLLLVRIEGILTAVHTKEKRTTLEAIIPLPTISIPLVFLLRGIIQYKKKIFYAFKKVSILF